MDVAEMDTDHEILLYPTNGNSLVEYLKKYPKLDVKFPSKHTEYIFKEFDDLRIDFITPAGDGACFPINSFIDGTIEFNEDGFTHTIGPMTGYFYYTGPKPWKVSKPPHKQSQEDWDDIIKTLELMV